MTKRIFNPLDKENLGKSVVEALLDTEELPFEALTPFSGAGIYAIYYRGDFEPYAKLAKRNRDGANVPIYVGKAIPKGGRKGLKRDASLKSAALHGRLRKHRQSVESARNLEIEAFDYRYLVIDDIWIGLAESLLIQRFEPLWNQVVEGFGNHDPGKGRRAGMRPLWDELHPGRPWAEMCSPPSLTETP